MSDAINQPQVVSVATENSGAQINTIQIPRQYWVKLTPKMLEVSPAGTPGIKTLPYIYVRNTPETNGEWQVVETALTPSSAPFYIRLPITGTGQYRLYVKEPTENYTAGQTFTVPFHVQADGQNSTREVQPWYALNVSEGNTSGTLLVSRSLPNGLNRPAGDYNPTGANVTLTNVHLAPAKALDLGDYVFTAILWGDISKAYGSNHPSISSSPHRSALEKIYEESLSAENGARVLEITNPERKIFFDAMSTAGGSERCKSFLNEQRMSRDECLRRTHPIVMEFILETITSLNIHHVRLTGAWRPHTGSTRHRYASALDVTHISSYVETNSGQTAEVECRFHRTVAPGPESNPTGTGASTSAQQRRKLSKNFHTYLAQRKQLGELGWLGGPWQLRYSDIGLTGSSVFINTNTAHIHHIHISVGTDQP